MTEAWDRAYRDGLHEQQWDTPWASPELAGAIAWLDAGSALDIGCGTGADAVYLACRGFDTVGVDVSERALELAQARAVEFEVTVSWRIGSALDLPVEDESIDLVTDRGCLHHIPPNDRPRYIAEVARVLRPGGCFVVRGMSESGRHKHPVTADAVATMVEDSVLHLRTSIPFDMVGTSGYSPATLAVVTKPYTAVR